jgi:inorganic pyrophosphatase
MEVVATSFNTFKAYAFPIGGVLLVLYPAMLMVWTILEGHAAARSSKKDNQSDVVDTCCGATGTKDQKQRLVNSNSLAQHVKGLANAAKAVASGHRNRSSLLSLATISVALLWSRAIAESFVHFGCSRLSVQAPTAASKVEAMSKVESQPPFKMITQNTTALVLGASALMATAFTATFRRLNRNLPCKASCPLGHRSRATKAARSSIFAPVTAKVFSTSGKRDKLQNENWSTVPEACLSPGPSLWHDVALYEQTWLDEPTGLLRYVNEMPMGTLRKYEVQPGAPNNVIEEDLKGSAKLAKFGKPVPFNYGCFPQTYRDPNKADEVYSAPGDDDPLDVIDLSDQPTKVGTIVRCRPLGAVCLIDEGQADWKVLVVNVDAKSPLADAMSIQDVERLAPGRIQACWAWMDELKRAGGKGNARLHREIHDAQSALKLIEEDHKSWRELVQSAGADGTARGHWIRSSKAEVEVITFRKAVEALKLGWAPLCAVPGQLQRVPGLLTGSARVEVLSRAARSFACSRSNSGS